MVAYINEKAGTHRTAGGSLDATAGTIPALDTIVSKFTGGAALSTVSEEVAAAAKGLTDKYAAYYMKVFEKLTTNSGYVEKESNRLKSLLKKGGLAPEKLDDLVKRSNILSKFSAKVEELKQEL